MCSNIGRVGGMRVTVPKFPAAAVTPEIHKQQERDDDDNNNKERVSPLISDCQQQHSNDAV